MDFLLGIALLVSFILFLQWLFSSPFTWQNKGIKWLTPWPLFGNTFSTFWRTYIEFWHNFYKTYRDDKVVGFHLFNNPSLLVRDPDLIRQVMIIDADSYTSRGLYANENDPFSKNLLVLDGEEWRVTRNKLTPYFSPARIKAMLPYVKDSVAALCRYMNLSSLKGPVDIDNLSMKLSTDVVVSTAFGLIPDAFTNSDSFFFKLQRELLGFLCGLRLLIGFMSPLLYRTLGLTLLSKQSSDKICGFVSQIVELRSKGEGVRPDLMQGLYEIYKKDCQSNGLSKEDNTNRAEFARFDFKRLLSQCMITFTAGTDSTGHTLSFCLYELACNQNVQERLRAEIMKTQQENNGDCGYDQLSQMTYLDMVYSETLRKYPAIVVIARKCTKPTTIGNLNISKGTFIAIPIIGLHHDPKYYPEPNKFDPERFAANAVKEGGTYLPFGLGPRSCLGTRLATIEIKLTLCEVLKNFHLLPSPETPEKLDFCFGPTLNPVNGINIKVIPLSNKLL